MDTSVWCVRGWIFLSILRIINTASNDTENCKELFDGLDGTNRIEIEEDNYINLTVYPLDASRCNINDQNVLQVKLTYQVRNKTVDLCKFTIRTICEPSDSSTATSNCRCLNNHTAQFLKKATSSDSRLYTWKWRQRGSEEQRDIFIDVRKANLYDDTATAATTASVTCVFLGLVVVVCLRQQAKKRKEVQDRGRDYRYSRSGGAADNQVRGQSFSQAEDPHYVDIIEPTASHHDDHIYTDVTEHHWIQNYNPNYGEVKEQNTTQPAKLGGWYWAPMMGSQGLWALPFDILDGLSISLC